MRVKSFICILLISISAVASEKAVVKSITDVDTITVILRGQAIHIRLIGIDTPESRVNHKPIRDSNRTRKEVESLISRGRRASAFLKLILHKGDTVSIETDIEWRDKYGRTLAYIYLSDGRFLNDLIISSGYASPLTIPPNIKYKDRFLKSYRIAREKKIGLWAVK